MKTDRHHGEMMLGHVRAPTGDICALALGTSGGTEIATMTVLPMETQENG